MTLYKMENRKVVETTALINSGATICCINLHLAKRMKWPLEKLPRLMYTQNTNRTNNSGGMIHHQVKLHLQIKGKTTLQSFFVLNLGGQDNIILGYPWLTKNNPQIDWGTGEVHMIRTPIPRHDEPEVVEQRYLMRYLGVTLQSPLCCCDLLTAEKDRKIQEDIWREPPLHQKAHPLYCPCPNGRKG